jgi:hypothetical protein
VSRARWSAALGRIEFDLDTGAGRHRISWRRGRLALHDHDVEAEAVLRALGGEPCLCLSVLDALRDSLGTAPRGPSPAAIARIRQSPQFASMTKGQQDALLAIGRRRAVMAMLPAPMTEVLGQVSEVRRERRVRSGSRPRQALGAEDRLQHAVAPAAEAAMRRSRRDLRPYASLEIECWRRRADEAPLLKGVLDGTGGFLAVSLPVSWLNRVWARGLAVVDGHLVLEVDRSAPELDLEAVAVRWERRVAGPSVSAAVPCRLHRGANRAWTLTW